MAVNTKRAVFISIEGTGEGVGKTTLVEGLKKRLPSDKFYFTREIGGIGSPVAEAVRNVVLDKNLPAMDPITEELLVMATRTAHMYDVVLPKLEAGINVISDRCMLSSMAYQGKRGDSGVARVLWDHAIFFHRFFLKLGYSLSGFPRVDNTSLDGSIMSLGGYVPLPNLIYVLDMPVDASLARKGQCNPADMNRIDLELRESHDLIYQGYHEAIKVLNDFVYPPPTIKLVDAEQSKDDVLAIVMRDLTKHCIL
ncbi:hypothetical protein FWF48_01415 [Candidatus Saccharibacteria bacterium]|nr:hypothetical protein [Candidatus Saccharibacteria bacterium]